MKGLTLLHSERPKLYTILAFLSAIGLNGELTNYPRITSGNLLIYSSGTQNIVMYLVAELSVLCYSTIRLGVFPL